MKNLFVGLAVALFLVPLSLSAQLGTWTAVASTGSIDETSLAAYQTNGTFLQHVAGSVAPVVARYNVTNTFGGGIDDQPGWQVFELGYADNAAGALVSATLFEVERCTGNRVVICTINSVDNAVPACLQCAFAANTFDFATNLYYVEVTVSRNANNIFPSARTLRIF
jgi:hypothetical protein